MRHSVMFPTLIVLWLVAGGTVSNAAGPGDQPAYAGDEVCEACHENIYNTYIRTGHPYKIQEIAGAPPAFPPETSPGVPNPPADKTWGDISFVIGGFAWKARFMDKEGYLLTGKDNRQYNLPNALLGTAAGWTGYDAGKAPRTPYTCGGCHTTGWVATGKDGPHQNGLPGIHGTWQQPGVRCEACHGPGGAHVEDPENVRMSKSNTCGECHKRGDATKIDAAQGLIRHHEQYEDLLASPHRDLECTNCHDPHKSVKYGGGGFKGARRTCLDCHEGQVVTISAKQRFECVTCHMPRAAKSAVSVIQKRKGGETPEGDVRAHLFRISTDPDWKMFTDDGKFVRVDSEGDAYISVEYACLVCHQDKDAKWALQMATTVHPK